MNLIKSCLLFSFLLSLSQLHSQDSVNVRSNDRMTRINNYLTDLYKQHFHSIDTTSIDLRKETMLLINSGDRQMQANGYTTRALLNMYARKYDAAIIDFKKAISLDSTCFICYYKLHWTYFYGKDNVTEAWKLRPISNRIFEKVVLADSLDIINWEKLYDSYELQESTRPKAINDRLDYIAWKIVALDSANARSWWEYSFHTGRNTSKERYALEKAFQLEPTQTIYWNALANFYTKSKDTVHLRQVIEASRPSSESDLEYWYQQKAVYLYRLGLKTEAAEVAKEAKSKGINIVYKF